MMHDQKVGTSRQPTEIVPGSVLITAECDPLLTDRDQVTQSRDQAVGHTHDLHAQLIVLIDRLRFLSLMVDHMT